MIPSKAAGIKLLWVPSPATAEEKPPWSQVTLQKRHQEVLDFPGPGGHVGVCLGHPSVAMGRRRCHLLRLVGPWWVELAE